MSCLRKLKELSVGAERTTVPPIGDADARCPAGFLAEVCGEKLYDQRQLVKTHLQQSNLLVLPSRSFGRNLTPDMNRELSESLLFIQMLGRFGGGYERLHCDRMLAAEVPVLQWCSRDLDLSTVEDSDHRQLLGGDDVQAMDFDELKRTIIDRVRVLSVRRPDVAIGGERFVLINASTADFEIADAIAKQLEEWNVGYDVVDDTVSLRDLADSTPTMHC